MEQAVLRGRQSALTLEQLGEVLDIHDAAVKGDGLYLQVGGVEQIRGVFDPSLADIF